MSTVLDFSYSKPTPEQVKSVGAEGVIGYISPETGKNLTVAEIEAYLAAGLSVTLVFEDSSTNALGGSSQGKSDATLALSQAKALGYPDDCTIFFAVDFDVTPTQESAVIAYFHGVESVIGHARTGAYGGYYPLGSLHSAGLASFYWQTLAWSGGQVQPFISLYQNGQQVFSGGSDVNEVRGPWVAWEGRHMFITIGTTTWPGDTSGNRQVYKKVGVNADGSWQYEVLGSSPQGGVLVIANPDEPNNPVIANATGGLYRWDGKNFQPIGGTTYIPSSGGAPAPHSHTFSGTTAEGG